MLRKQQEAKRLEFEANQAAQADIEQMAEKLEKKTIKPPILSYFENKNQVDPMCQTTKSDPIKHTISMPIEAITYDDIKGKVSGKDLCLDDLMRAHKGIKVAEEEKKALFLKKKQEYKEA